MYQLQQVLGNIISDLGIAIFALILAYLETSSYEEATLSDLKKYSCLICGIIVIAGVILQVTALLDYKIV
jgi:hypothetical protein